MLPRITIIEILHENPKFEIFNRRFSKLGCTPSFESHFIDNKELENEASMIPRSSCPIGGVTSLPDKVL
jgi:hypothetical protein